jgi:hypothetical protein
VPSRVDDALLSILTSPVAWTVTAAADMFAVLTSHSCSLIGTVLPALCDLVWS